MSKSPEAFRTISEVADWLDTPAHVLRFWESKFSQIKPVKRAGGRRYYRPEDMALLAGIKLLLHEQGMTIKGVQKLLREKGVRHVADQAAGLAPDPAEGGAFADPAPPISPPISMTPDRSAEQRMPPAPDAAGQEFSPPPPAGPRAAMPPPEPLPEPLPMHAARPPQLPPLQAGTMPPRPAPPERRQGGAAPPPPADQAARPAARGIPALPDPRPAAPGLLSKLARMQGTLRPAQARALAPLVRDLAALRDRLRQDPA